MNSPAINKILFVFLTFISTSSLAVSPDWSAYQQLLNTYVSQGEKDGVKLNVVDYPALKQSDVYKQAVAQLEQFDTRRLETKEERLAFYINAYNLYAIKMVVDHWPVESIKDVGSWFSPVWKKSVGRLAGREVTLDEIEHKILRPMGQPRIHMAIVCASVSCPDLRREPYNATDVYQQLDDQVRGFLSNPEKGLRVQGNTVYVSKIFDWFKEDFDALGGVKAFIQSYKDIPPNADIEADIFYNWKLNYVK